MPLLQQAFPCGYGAVVLEFLDPRDIVRLGACSRECRQEVAKHAAPALDAFYARRGAREAGHWRLLRAAHGFDLQLVAEKCGLRPALDKALCGLADTLDAVATADPCDPDAAFHAASDMLRQVLEVGTKLAHKDRHQRDSRAVTGVGIALRRALRASSADFGALLHQRMLVFLTEYDVWHGGFIHWHEVPWRRSAVAFLGEFFAATGAFGISEAMLKDIDENIMDVMTEAMELQARAPIGVPGTHWWWNESTLPLSFH